MLIYICTLYLRVVTLIENANMTDIKRIGDTGIHTVEGNIAGGRAARLTKRAEAERIEYEQVAYYNSALECSNS